ncbi:hypothetical protein O7626_40415 [Micromonospora sp. WMMD1102]|uniref:hypothetical protein n=1 Tax=Micromonospora sp. WMMD1102 TaxID=3016105 RepID=UPI0024150CCB|nr:hypothetical protein [Micromonospora sp. WMMD1102]MDG4792083.1 hypothetical protein [Micromonospora sp. WMMD1102]
MDSTSTLPAPLTTRHGALSIQSSRTVEGGFAINTYAGTTAYRHDELSFTTPDQATAILAREVIATGGEAFKSPEEIRADLNETLTAELHRMQRRTDGPSRARVEHLNALLDLVDPISEETLNALTAQVGTALAEVAAEIPHPRTFKEFRDEFRAGMERDRAERAARTGVAR